ncbi:MAG: NADPH-dependent reductase [Firmicutes bacterium]|nr:NADPH-dependent reductase [Bacillota bacterium]
MKVLAINGSQRGKNGYTQFLIEKLFEGVIRAGGECESVTLSELNIKRCTGCFTCQKADHYLKCIFDGIDDVATVYEKMRQADIIIFGTPVYIFTMSGLLLNLLDRYPSTSNCSDLNISKSGLFFHQIDTAICSKPFVTLICQDNIETETHKNIISYFKTYSRFMDAPYIGSLIRKSAIIAGYGKNDAKLLEYPLLNEIYAAFRKAGEELVISGRINKATQKKANQELIKLPHFVKPMLKLSFFRKIIQNKIKNFMVRQGN